MDRSEGPPDPAFRQYPTVSLNQDEDREGNNKETLQDFVADANAGSGERWHQADSTLRFILNERRRISRLIQDLRCSESTRRIFRARYRLDEPGVIRRRMIDVAAMYGLSESRISQVLARVWFVLRRRQLADGLSDRWFGLIPSVVTTIAELISEDYVSDFFGPRDLWHVKTRRINPEGNMPRKKVGQVTTPIHDHSTLLGRLHRLEDEAQADLLVGFVERLNSLTEQRQRIFALRFGLHDGSLDQLTPSEIGRQLNLKSATVATAMSTGLAVMRNAGLPKSVTVRKLAGIVADVQECLKKPIDTGAPQVEMPAAGPASTAPAVVSDFRERLLARAQRIALEDDVIHRYLVGPTCRSGRSRRRRSQPASIWITIGCSRFWRKSCELFKTPNGSFF